MTGVSLENISKTYPGSEVAAVDDVLLNLESGTLTAILGPSGCGKSTILKMIAGLLSPDAGDIKFDGRSIIAIAPEHRSAVMMFQDHLLFPYMTVAENIGFGLKMQGQDKADIRQRVGEIMERVRLHDLGHRKPHELSGGQQQRVALARALVVRPKILLLDEPLSDLDAHLRVGMRELIRSLQQEMRITTLFVTHDQEEAVVLADRIALVLDGRLKQAGPPADFFERPEDETVARFFGGRNFIPGTIEGEQFISGLGNFSLPEDFSPNAGLLTFRPENVHVGETGLTDNKFTATVTSKSYLGTQTRLHLRAGQIDFEALINPEKARNIVEGMDVPIHIPRNALWTLH